jgi:class 3 adenylate cyclase
LLESVYGAFDEIARRRKIFKVETVGDCYVAVCGLPQPRNDHAVAMVRFARECLKKMASMSQELEISLGPGKKSVVAFFGNVAGQDTISQFPHPQTLLSLTLEWGFTLDQ